MATTTTTTKSSTVQVSLKKHRPGCTGMFWRPDPTGANRLASNNDWPRDGAKLRGHTIQHKGQDWLLATEVLQANSKTWVKTPVGAALPYEYNNHYYLQQE